MFVRLVLAFAAALMPAVPAFAGGPPPVVDDPPIATFVPTGAQGSLNPLAPTFVAPGLFVTPASQVQGGEWFNTDIWPVQVSNGFDPARYIDFLIGSFNDRVVRVTRLRYASRSYFDSNNILTLATDADGFALTLGAASSVGTGFRSVPLEIFPSSDIEFGPGVRIFRLFPFRTTPQGDWLDLVAADGGLRIDGRIALVRSLGVGQDRYSFNNDLLGGEGLPAAITHVQFVSTGTAVILSPFAATAPRTACLPGVAVLDLSGRIDAATVTGTGAPCGTIDPLAGVSTSLWRLADDSVYAVQVVQVVPNIVFRVRRMDDSVFANGFE